ncbi:MAG: DUF952 domain-containing protein [Parachlamydiaceae bacterium]|nr:DUF952 domain-containing protein [Parachlamydiaceae bacterium]
MTADPATLYKILALDLWRRSQNQDRLELPVEDEVFIHLSTEDQLERILKKFWSHTDAYVILKVDPRKLPGRLLHETNPGGTQKYYHLYDGYIPLKAVVR